MRGRRWKMGICAVFAMGLGTAALQAAVLRDGVYGGNLWDIPTAMIVTSDGGYLLAGESDSAAGGEKTAPMYGMIRNNDLWLVKVGANGARQWDRTLGSTLEETAAALYEVEGAGGYYVGGTTYSGQGDDVSATNRGVGGDFWLVRLAADGTKLWDARYGGGLSDVMFAMVPTADNGFLLGGWSYSDAGGDRTDATRGGLDYWIVKVDADGHRQWDKAFGGASDDELTAIGALTDGGFVLGGWSASGAEGDRTAASRGGRDYWLVRIDADGNKVWDRRFGGPQDDTLKSLQIVSGGAILLGGTSESGAGGDKSEASRGMTDYWVVKVDGAGNKLWDKTLGGNHYDEFAALVETAEGDYLAGGGSWSGRSGDKSEEGLNSYDFWVIGLSSSGAKLWDKVWGASNDDQLRCMLESDAGTLVMLGESYSPADGDKSGANRGNCDYWLVEAAIPQRFALQAQANGSGGPLVVPAGTRVSLDVAVIAGELAGRSVDWWIAVSSPFGFFSYNIATGQWAPGLRASGQGPVGNLAGRSVLRDFLFPVGRYQFFFCVDTQVNGQLDFQSLRWDAVTITVAQ